MSCDVAFSHFNYVTAHSHSPSLPSLHLRHSSFTNPSLALPTSQLILQPYHCFTYVTAHSPTLLSLLLRHRIFTYVAWSAAHVVGICKGHFFVPPVPAYLQEIRDRITATVVLIDHDMLTRVWNELDYRLDVCRISQGGHIEHL